MSIVDFESLVGLFPDEARPSHDRLFQAVEGVLGGCSEADAQRLVRVLDPSRLSPAALARVVESDRIPLAFRLSFLLDKHQVHHTPPALLLYCTALPLSLCPPPCLSLRLGCFSLFLHLSCPVYWLCAVGECAVRVLPHRLAGLARAQQSTGMLWWLPVVLTLLSSATAATTCPLGATGPGQVLVRSGGPGEGSPGHAGQPGSSKGGCRESKLLFIERETQGAGL